MLQSMFACGVSGRPSSLSESNALTVGRLLVIPVFVAMMVKAGGGHSWPAAIVFGAAGEENDRRCRDTKDE